MRTATVARAFMTSGVIVTAWLPVSGCKSNEASGSGPAAVTSAASSVATPSVASASETPASTPVLGLATAKVDCVKKELKACTTACEGGDHPSCVLQADLAWKAGDHAAVVVPLARACEGGIPRACSIFASRLADERVQPQLTESRRKARRASFATQGCEGNDGLGCSTLARFTAEGFGGLTQDAAKAEALYRKSLTAFTRECDGNDAQSCFLLGMQHDFGKHAPKDAKKAAALYKKACEGGSEEGCTAAKNLGQ